MSFSGNFSPEYILAAQRVERCLSILERFAEQCQVSFYFTHLSAVWCRAEPGSSIHESGS